MKYFIGIDIGSTAIKIAVLNDDKNICALGQSPTGSRFNLNTQDTLDRLFLDNQLDKSLIAYTVTTGYGRKLFKSGDENINELTSNVEGAIFMAPRGSNIQTIINIGGQDTKIIQLDQHYQMTNFVMNDKCAAGTGRFLDIAARNLEVDVGEMEQLHYQALDRPLPINSTCAVFAESEIISLLAAGHDTSEIACGIHYSIAKRIVRLASRIQMNDEVLFDGGPALNRGMIDAIENELMRKVVVQPHPQYTTAIGASVYALKQYEIEYKSAILK